jgi:TonB family protein
MPAVTLTNLFLYAAQAALVIGALAALFAALRLSPAFRLAACRAVLVALLVLPWLALLRTPSPELPPVSLAGATPGFVDAIDARVPDGIPWGAIVGGVVAAGVVLRLLWLGVGLVRLSRLTRRLPEAETTDEVDALQAELGTRARVHFAPGLAQPVTFGVAPAVVLLPAALRDASPEQRTAVLCHELLHVQRRDWPWVLLEEAVLALLWFHPAVWWLVGELQLAREQVVDRLTVAATGARRAYMDALFSAADAPSAPPLLAGFLRRRHLARRLIALTEEVVMSHARVAVGGVLMVGVLIGSGAVALAAWPLAVVQAPGEPHVMRFQPAGASPVASRTDVLFPSGLSQEMTGAMVLLDAVVDASGAVTSVRLVSLSARNETTGATLSAGDMRTVEAMMNDVARGRVQGNTTARHMFGDGAALTRDLETVAKSASAALQQWRFVPPQAAPAIARVSVVFDVTNSRATFGPVQPLSGFPMPPSSNFASAPPPPSSSDGVLRVGGVIKPPTKIVNVAPIYPQEAKDARVQGVVVIEMIVDEAGAVKEAWILKSIPLFDESALEAVRQWRYEPTLLNGVPRPVRMTVTVNFTLAP